MRSVTTFLVLAPLFVASLAQARVVDTTRTVGTFDGVHVASGIEARVETGPIGPVTLRGEEADLAKVKTVIEGTTLVIRLEENSGRTGTIQVTVRLPRAKALAVSGGSRMHASVPAGDTLTVAASGGGTIELPSKVQTKTFALAVSGGSRAQLGVVEAGKMELMLSGASRAQLTGRTDDARASLSGAAELEASGLSIARLDVDASGGSRLEARAAKARGALSGGCRVRVARNAEVQVDVAGGSTVKADL